LALDELHVAQPAGGHHLAPRQDEAAVAALLAEVIELAGALGGEHDAPAVLDRVGRRHLAVHVHPGLQGLGGHGALAQGAHRERHGVDVGLREELLVVLEARDPAGPLQRGEPALVQPRHPIAQRRDPVARHPVDQPRPVQPARAQPRHADPYLVHRPPPSDIACVCH